MKLIFLILANDTDNYLKMQELWKMYMDSHENIKSYFIKYNLNKLNNDKDIFMENNTIYIKGNKESIIPGCLDKTIKSIEYILDNEKFDYIIRTNMSSVWDLNKIYNLLSSNDFVTGGVIGKKNSQQFISGAGILLRNDICKMIIENKNYLDYNIIDDVSIGIFLTNNNIHMNPLTRFEAYNYENDLDKINKCLDGSYFHFRCKSNKDSDNTINTMRYIINLIYGL